jgi:transcriptional regulator GlxA family with amidase domain
MAGSVIAVSLQPWGPIGERCGMKPSTRGALLAALLGIVATSLSLLAITTPLAMGLIHPAPVAAPSALPPSTPLVRDPSRRTVAVLMSQAGTEVTDLLAPYAIFSASDAFTVLAVAEGAGLVPTNGGLGVVPQQTLAAFDAAHPGGADVVVIPNVLDPDAPALLRWVREQAAHGALVVSVCEGARLLAGTGLLDGRAATSHFLLIGDLAKKFPRVRWRDDRRYVVDGDLVTSAGVTAAIDASLYVVTRIAGPDAAARAAHALQLPPRDDVAVPAPVLTAGELTIGVANAALLWPKQQVLVRLRDGVDELELAAVLDAYPRTFAAASASTTPDRLPVRSRFGLVLVPSRAAGAPNAADIVVDPTRGDGSPYDRVLRALAARFGGRTAALVADQLQYPAAHLALDAVPTSGTRYAIPLALLLGCGAASGLLVRRAYRRRRAQRTARTPGLLTPTRAART